MRRKSAALHVKFVAMFSVEFCNLKEKKRIFLVTTKTEWMHDSSVHSVISMHLSAHDHYNCFFFSCCSFTLPSFVRCFFSSSSVVVTCSHTAQQKHPINKTHTRIKKKKEIRR